MRTPYIDQLKKILPSNRDFEMSDLFLCCPYTLDELKQKNRRQDIREWRQVALAWGALNTNSISSSGYYFSMNHATVIHSIKRVINAIMGYDPNLNRKLNMVLKRETNTIRVSDSVMTEVVALLEMEKDFFNRYPNLIQSPC